MGSKGVLTSLYSVFGTGSPYRGGPQIALTPCNNTVHVMTSAKGVHIAYKATRGIVRLRIPSYSAGASGAQESSGNMSTAMDTILKTAALLSALSLCFAGDDTLNFSLIVSFGQEGFNSSASVPAVDLALEHIKEQNILGGYVLNYTTLRDSEVAT